MFWIVQSRQGKCDEIVITVIDLERILRDGCTIATVSSIATPVRNLPTASQSLDATLEEVTVTIPGAGGAWALSGLADKPVLGEHITSMFPITKSCPSAVLEGTVSNQIASIQSLAEDTIVRHFNDERLAM